MIDLESEVEELHDSEQRWAAKQKRAIEQVAWPRISALNSTLKLLKKKKVNISNAKLADWCRLNRSLTLRLLLLSGGAAAAEVDPGERSQRPAGAEQGHHRETGALLSILPVCTVWST